MTEKKETSYSSILKLITNILEKYKNEKLTSANCQMIYQDIFGVLVDVVKDSGIENQISNEALNFAAQGLYFSIEINGGQELDPNIFTQKAKIENISTKDLLLLCTLLSGSEIAVGLAHYISKRR